MNVVSHLLTCAAEEGVEIAEDARLLAEECQRTAHALSKIACKTLRFGKDEVNVLEPDGPTNAERLVGELNDLLAIADMLARAGVIREDWQCPTAQADKRLKVEKFMRYAREIRALEP